MTENNKWRYANSKIYKLIDHQGYYYWGSTCLPLHKRLYSHKEYSKRDPEMKIYTIFTHERFVNGEIKIVLEKEFSLTSQKQLLREENKFITVSLEDIKCLNSNRKP